jgi:hypothetical protein
VNVRLEHVAFVQRLKSSIAEGSGLEVWAPDPSVGFRTKRFALAQRTFIVPRRGVEIEWFDDHLEMEIDFPEALVLCTVEFIPEDGDELVTCRLTLDEVLEVWEEWDEGH